MIRLTGCVCVCLEFLFWWNLVIECFVMCVEVKRVRNALYEHAGVPTGHQLAATWVNTTRYCKYSQVLLMMGENIARNM